MQPQVGVVRVGRRRVQAADRGADRDDLDPPGLVRAEQPGHVGPERVGHLGRGSSDSATGAAGLLGSLGPPPAWAGISSGAGNQVSSTDAVSQRGEARAPRPGHLRIDP